MTIYVNLRSLAADQPQLLEGDGTGTDPKLVALAHGALAARAAGRPVLMAIHGFNVSYRQGLNTLARLEAAMNLAEEVLFLGVLWPGDFWIPVVNYPFEAADAVRCGKLLGRFCNRWLASAAGLSFVSHSLGGRVVLETVRHSERERIDSICLTAAAVDDNCLTRHYSDARAKCSRIYVLSSTRDRVLHLAYPAGDFLSDLFGDPDSPFRAALGRKGPKPAAGPSVRPDAIPPRLDHGHGDYFADSLSGRQVADYAARAFAQAPKNWPPLQ